MKEMNLSQDKASRKELQKFLKGNAKPDHRERKETIQIRVTKKEKYHITKLADAVGLSVSEMVRQLTNGIQIHVIPPEEYLEVCTELRDIRSWMNNAYLSNDVLDEYLDRLDKCTAEFKEIAERFYGDSYEEIVADYPSYVEKEPDYGDY